MTFRLLLHGILGCLMCVLFCEAQQTYQNVTIVQIELVNDLAPSNNRSGRVMIRTVNNVIGSICPKNWDVATTNINVNITCRMFGFRNGGYRISNTFGDGNKNFLIEDLTCSPNSTSLVGCTQVFAKSCGAKDEELAIECNPDTNGKTVRVLSDYIVVPPAGGIILADVPSVQMVMSQCGAITTQTIRLYGGNLTQTQGIGNGYVEVYDQTSNTWGFVCDDKWNSINAKVVCAEMCFPTDPSFEPLPGVLADTVPYPPQGQIVWDDVQCEGDEPSLGNCSRSATVTCVPGKNSVAGVQCLPAKAENTSTPNPDVVCGNGVLTATFPASKFPMLGPANIMMANDVPDSCVTKSMSDGGAAISITVPVTPDCGTSLSQNDTHLTYNNTVRIFWGNGAVMFQYINQRYTLLCSLPKVNNVTNRYQPFTLSPLTQIHEKYNFSLRLELYNSTLFASPMSRAGSAYLIGVGDWVNAAVVMDSYDERLKLLTIDCDAFPVMPVSTGVPVQTLIKEKCPVQTTLAMYPLSNFKQGFRFKALMFGGYSMVYLQCFARICLAADPLCDRSCPTPTARRKREATHDVVSSVDSSTIVLYDRESDDFSELLNSLQRASSNNSEWKATTANSHQQQPKTTTTLKPTTTTTMPPPNQSTGHNVVVGKTDTEPKETTPDPGRATPAESNNHIGTSPHEFPSQESVKTSSAAMFSKVESTNGIPDKTLTPSPAITQTSTTLFSADLNDDITPAKSVHESKSTPSTKTLGGIITSANPLSGGVPTSGKPVPKSDDMPTTTHLGGIQSSTKPTANHEETPSNAVPNGVPRPMSPLGEKHSTAVPGQETSSPVILGAIPTSARPGPIQPQPPQSGGLIINFGSANQKWIAGDSQLVKVIGPNAELSGAEEAPKATSTATTQLPGQDQNTRTSPLQQKSTETVIKETMLETEHNKNPPSTQSPATEPVEPPIPEVPHPAVEKLVAEGNVANQENVDLNIFGKGSQICYSFYCLCTTLLAIVLISALTGV